MAAGQHCLCHSECTCLSSIRDLMPGLQLFHQSGGRLCSQVGNCRHAEGGGGQRGSRQTYFSPSCCVYCFTPHRGNAKGSSDTSPFFFFFPSLRQLDWKSFKDLEASSHTFRLAPLMRHPDLLCYSDVEPSEMLKYYVFPSLALLPREHKAARVKSAQCWVLFAGSGWRGSVTQWLCLLKSFFLSEQLCICSPEPFRVLCTFF